MTEHLKLMLEYKKLNTESIHLHMSMPCAIWDQQTRRYVYANPEDEALNFKIRGQIQEVNKKQSALISKFKALDKVEIKDATNIFGARVTTYFQKVEDVSCNTLDKIALSDVKGEGIIYTPFRFLTDGRTILDNKNHKYRIKRTCDGKVYWLFTIDSYDLIADEKNETIGEEI